MIDEKMEPGRLLSPVAVLFLLLMSTAAADAQSTRGQTQGPNSGTYGNGDAYPHGHPEETSTGQSPHGSGDGAMIGAAVGGAAAAVLITELFMHHDTPSKIASHGPEVPKQLDMSGFTIKGLARPGWPVVVDYVLNGSGSVQINVTGDDHSEYTCILPGRDRRRGFQIFNLPANFGKSAGAQQSQLPGGACPPRVMHPGQPEGKQQIAVYKITAVPPAGSSAAAPQLRIFGLGAGENAVGSVAIDQLTFQPPTVHAEAKEQANFGFHAHSAFDGERAGFIFTTLYNGHLLVQQDQEQSVQPVPENQYAQGTWKYKGQPKPGEHMLQVRAWRGLQNGGDWVVAWSPDIVDVQ